MKHKVATTVNGQRREHEVEPRLLLVHYLRDVVGLTGTHIGCDTSQCGACTVLMDGKAVRSCTTPVSRAAGHAITTIEGLGTPEKPDRVQAAFIAEQAAQCGYCTSGMIMAAAAFLSATPSPTIDQARQGLAGNLCRCGTHTRILRAVLRAALKTRGPAGRRGISIHGKFSSARRRRNSRRHGTMPNQALSFG